MAVRALPRRLVSALPKSESAQTLVSSAANKRGLSKMLDGTLREGAHDMRVFGLGFLRRRSLATTNMSTSRPACFISTGRWRSASQRQTACQNWCGASSRSCQGRVRSKGTCRWLAHGRESGLPMSAATERYVHAIHTAADEEGGVRLLSHLYVRYFADLFGGRALGAPTRIALSLPETPHFYVWCASVETDRRAYIERIYEELNAAGDAMDGAEQRDRVVEGGKSGICP